MLKLVLGARESFHFPLVFMNRLNETELAVFKYCRLCFPYYFRLLVVLQGKNFQPDVKNMCSL